MQDLEGKSPRDSEVVAAQEAVMGSPPVKAILGEQEAGGWWVGEKDMYNPKYTATTHSMRILAELGAKRTPSWSAALSTSSGSSVTRGTS